MKKNILILLILGLFGQIQAMDKYQITDIWSYDAPGGQANKLKKCRELKDNLFSYCTHFMYKDWFPAQSSDSDCPTCLNDRAKINNLSVRKDFFNKLRDKVTIALEKNNASEINITTLGGAHMGFEFFLLHWLNVTLQNKIINLINLEGGNHKLSNDYKGTIKSFFNNYFDEQNAARQKYNNEFNFYYYFNETQEYLEHSKENTNDSLNILLCLCLDETPNKVDDLSKMLFQNNTTNENYSMSDSFSSLCENLPENSVIGLLAGNTMTLCSLIGEKQDKESYNCNLYFEDGHTNTLIQNENHIAIRQFIDDEELTKEEEKQITLVSSDDVSNPSKHHTSDENNKPYSITPKEGHKNTTAEEPLPNKKTKRHLRKIKNDDKILTPKRVIIGTSIIAVAVALYLGHNWIVENKDWYNTLLHKIPFFKNN